jgi:D-alanyl-D-alanine carboxypeptidase (penicillin-binding protein 5/6)
LVINGLESNIKRANEAEKIFDYGFLNFDNLTLFKKDQTIADVDVWIGRDKTLSIASAEDIVITVPKDRQKDIKLTLEYNSPLKAPIKIGDKIADLNIEIPGLFSKTHPIFSQKEVKKLPFLSRIFFNASYLLFGTISK